MNSRWQSLSSLGVTANQPYVLVRRIRVQNQVSLLFISFLLFFTIVNIFNSKPALAVFEFCIAVLLLLPIYTNHKGYYNLSSIIFFTLLFGLVSILCFALVPKRELEHIFLVLGIIPLTSYKSKRIIYSLFILSFVLFVTAKVLAYGIQDDVIYLNYAVIFSMTFFLVKYLKDEFATNLKLIETQNGQLQKLNEEKSKLISIASHDLRSPLIRIQSLLSLLSIEGSLTPEQKNILITAQREAKHQTEMIKEILDLYAIDEGINKAKLEHVNVPNMIASLVSDFQLLANKKNIAIKYESKTPAELVIADPGYLKQVLENLLSNAIKFSYPNSTVTLTLQSTSQTMQISCKDEGQGLDTEDLKKLFKRFQRLSAQPTGGEASSGLGLSIAKKYMEVMNGSLVCISEKGKGATFTAELPLAPHVA